MRSTLLTLTLVGLAACSSQTAISITTIPPTVPTSSTTTSTTVVEATTTAAPREASHPEFDTWAIVLDSLPTEEFTLEEATERAEEQTGPADILLSDDYPSLNPGFWVVFNGPYASGSDASLRCAAMRADSVECYTRYLGVSLTAGVGFEFGTALISVEGGYGVFDLDTGERTRTIEATSEARHRLQPQLAQDGTMAFLAGNVEDYWFTCESAQGFIDKLDLASGEFDEYAVGTLARVSPGGRHLAYVESSGCIPDPLDGGFRAMSDTIVIVDLTTAATTRWPPAEDLVGQTYSFVTSLGWGFDSSYLLAVLGDGTLRRLEPAQVMPVTELPIVDATFVTPVELNARAATTIDLVAGRAESSMVAHRWSSIGSGRDGAAVVDSEIVEVETSSGAIQRTLVVLDGGFPVVSLDASYGNLFVLDRDGSVVFDDSGRFPEVQAGVGGADW